MRVRSEEQVCSLDLMRKSQRRGCLQQSPSMALSREGMLDFIAEVSPPCAPRTVAEGLNKPPESCARRYARSSA